MATVFDEIIAGTRFAYTIWENEGHMAFLTPYPSTPGFTVVIPKVDQGDNVFDMDEDAYAALLLATREVARLLRNAFDVPRVGMVFEGTGVAYVHAKLIPMHGPLAHESGLWPEGGRRYYTEQYPGYLTTLEGPDAPEAELLRVQALIRAATESH